jgi:hypothetical protein
VARHGLSTGSCYARGEVAEEGGVPGVCVAFEEAVCFLEGEEVENKVAQGRRLANLLI